MMNNEPFTYTDDDYTVTNAQPGIAPIRPGGPPLWIGGDGPAALKRATRFGNAWHAFNATPDQIRSSQATIHELQPERPIALTTTVAVSDTQQASEQISALSNAGAAWIVLSPAQPITSDSIELLATAIKLRTAKETK
jgi:alkanesulfonate monooxygenase SsuD/methylene tetrahydromethanopterin reductase-like flavin-dependent oxidoreductase (luciferase family)